MNLKAATGTILLDQFDALCRPLVSADIAGTSYVASVDADHRKTHGLYLTSVPVADFMAEQIDTHAKTIRILDPASGAGVLLCAAVEELVSRSNPPRRIELVAYEIDEKLVSVLTDSLATLKAWAEAQSVKIIFEVHCSDFVLVHGPALHSMGGFIPHIEPEEEFDIVIANPPYFKLNKSDPRAQAGSVVVSGQPNIYGLFMAVCAALLKPQGEFIFIVPRSFTSGPYFRKFRQLFFDCIRPEHVHVFGSRRDAFSRDDVLQENIIFKGVRQENWASTNVQHLVVISTSKGTRDLEEAQRRSASIADILDMTSQERVLRLPISQQEEELLRLVDRWPFSLNRLGMKISTGPVVPFRATEFLDKKGKVPKTHAPLLWMNHVKTMQVSWPIEPRKPEYIKVSETSRPLLVPNKNYVLLRRFSAKEEARRLVAGVYLKDKFQSDVVGLENHLNYIYRPDGELTETEALGISALLSSQILDTYFRACNGNTQVSATELRTMPLPSLKVISAIGSELQLQNGSSSDIDALIARHLEISEQLKVSAVG